MKVTGLYLLNDGMRACRKRKIGRVSNIHGLIIVVDIKIEKREPQW